MFHSKSTGKTENKNGEVCRRVPPKQVPGNGAEPMSGALEAKWIGGLGFFPLRPGAASLIANVASGLFVQTLAIGTSAAQGTGADEGSKPSGSLLPARLPSPGGAAPGLVNPRPIGRHGSGVMPGRINGLLLKRSK